MRSGKLKAFPMALCRRPSTNGASDRYDFRRTGLLARPVGRVGSPGPSGRLLDGLGNPSYVIATCLLTSRIDSMRLALIGCDNDVLRVVDAIGESSEHALVAVHNADAWRDQLVAAAPTADWSDEWEGLLAQRELDAVIVAKHDDSLVFEDQCRKLVQASIPLIVSHPLSDSLFAYELEMMREEVGGVIKTFMPGFQHPAFDRLAELIAQGDSSPIGTVEQIAIERFFPSRDRDSVFRTLAQDITLQRQLIGQISSINAIGAEHTDSSWANVAVNVTGTSEVVGRWSVSPETDDRTATFTLVGSRGKAVVTVRNQHRDWSLSIGDDEQQFDSHNDGIAVVEAVHQVKRGRESFSDYAVSRLQIGSPKKTPAPFTSTDTSEWEAVCHDLDATEQIHRSLRRKRTVELRRDSQNEEGAFKGIMSAGGCVMLMLAFLILMAFAIFEGFRMPTIDAGALRESGEPVPRMHVLLRLWPVYPLAAFLVMQFLVFIAKKPSAAVQSKNSVDTKS